MIQMRWIVVPAGSGRGILGGKDGQSFETVLQFRESRSYVLDQTRHESFDGVDWTDVTPPSSSLIT